MSEVFSSIATRQLLDQTRAHVRAQMSGEATGHDWWHVERVCRLTLYLAQHEGADPVICELAALLHDLQDWKFANGDVEAGPRAAAAWLTSQGAPAEWTQAVTEIIRGLSFKGAGVDTTMPTIEGRCVQDADRLDALGAIGIARTFAYGGAIGQPLHDPNLPPQPHTSFAAYRSARSTTINHFYEKLLLLRDRMQTDTGRQLALERHAVLDQFLQQFLAEWSFPPG